MISCAVYYAGDACYHACVYFGHFQMFSVFIKFFYIESTSHAIYSKILVEHCSAVQPYYVAFPVAPGMWNLARRHPSVPRSSWDLKYHTAPSLNSPVAPGMWHITRRHPSVSMPRLMINDATSMFPLTSHLNHSAFHISHNVFRIPYDA